MSAVDAGRLDLAGELTIVTAAEQNQRLLAALDQGVDLTIGLAEVTDLDTAGLQLLLLARREADRRDLTLRFRDASRAVTEVLAVAHLGADLEPKAASRPAVPVEGAPPQAAVQEGAPLAAESENAPPAAEPQHAPLATESQGAPLAIEPEGAPLATEPEGAPLAAEPENVPARTVLMEIMMPEAAAPAGAVAGHRAAGDGAEGEA